MFIEILLAVCIGACLGIFTGLTPGVHINLVAAILLTLTPFLGAYFNPVLIALAIVSMSVVHTFLDAIPSTFLGAPDEHNVLSALPAHAMLLEGRGFEAVKLLTIGSFLGLIAVVLLLPVLIVVVPFIFTSLQDYIGIILLVVVVALILKEEGFAKKFWCLMLFLLSGILGITVFSLNLSQPLFPMLSGLFGVSTLVMSLSQNTKVPFQRITNEIKIPGRELTRIVFGGTFAGSLVSIFPGMGPAQAATIGGSLIGKVKEYSYLILTGTIGTVSMLLSLITLYTINKARNGSIVVVQNIMQTVTFSSFILLMIVALLAGCIGVLLTMWFARIFGTLISKVNYAALCIGVIALVASLVFYFTGFLGLLVLVTATAIGILPELLGIPKNHAMGCLLLPVILYFIL